MNSSFSKIWQSYGRDNVNQRKISKYVQYNWKLGHSWHGHQQIAIKYITKTKKKVIHQQIAIKYLTKTRKKVIYQYGQIEPFSSI